MYCQQILKIVSENLVIWSNDYLGTATSEWAGQILISGRGFERFTEPLIILHKDTGLQLPMLAILVASKGRGEMFLFLLFLHFQCCSSFFPVPLFHLFYLFFPFLWAQLFKTKDVFS